MEQQKKDEDEAPAVQVYVRPLEVTVPSDIFTSSSSPPPLPTEKKSVWSTMTTRIEAETSVRQWSTPTVKTEEGQPPGPQDHPSTKEGKAREGAVKSITPSYKTSPFKSELNLGRTGHLPNEKGDYKMSMRQEDYKLTVIDPKVKSSANMPNHSMRLPDPKREIVSDFPSQHSKRSNIKLEPLEQRRFKSSESRPITTSNYLTESVERHRDMEASKLREYLKAKEGDANKPWNKPGWPGPKKNDDESLRELEHIKKSIETLQKKVVLKTQSMNDLRLLTPIEFDQKNQALLSPRESRDPGWLIRMRTSKYLQEANGGMRKHKSMDQLAKTIKPSTIDMEEPKSKNTDQLHWQLRKEFHLTKYSERRASWSQQVDVPSIERPRIDPPLPPPPLSAEKSRSQVLYPSNSFDQPETSKTSQRPPDKPHLDSRVAPPPSLIGISVEPPIQRQVPQRSAEEDYPERLMSPPPSHPRSILKQQQQQQQQQQYSSQQYSSSSSHQQYSAQHIQQLQYINEARDSPIGDRVEGHPSIQHSQPPPPPLSQPPSTPQGQPPPRMRGYSFNEMSEEDRYRIMQENLIRHRQSRNNTPKPPSTSFNGPFFKLEEVNRPRSQSVVPLNGREDDMDRQSYSLSQMKQLSSSQIELASHSQREPSVVVWPPENTKLRPRSQSVMSRNIADPDQIDELRRQKHLEKEAMRRHEEEQIKSMNKQIRAMQIQQQRIYEEQHGVTSPVPIIDSISPLNYPSIYTPQQQQQQPYTTQPIQNVFHPQQQQPYPQMAIDPDHEPQHMRIFETRPISSMSDVLDPNHHTWKRTYVVEKQDEIEKNQILTSEELLEKEQYHVDLLKRREAFVEKPSEQPPINRLGKTWQPPPERPYVWPTLRRPISVQPTEAVHFAPGVPMDDEEYKWAPLVSDPSYKREHKNFTPNNSPPSSPRRGMGTGPLDEPAKRQTKYLIQPSADGSHRPKPAFRKERHTPSGGFYPHAPNAIKLVKRRANPDQLSPGGKEEEDDIQVIHQRNYHRLEGSYHSELHRTKRKEKHENHKQEDTSALNDWEKIYELPPHSSTLVGKDVPRNVDVRRRLSQFEGSIQNLAGRQSVTRADSVDSAQSINYPPPDYHQEKPKRSQSRQENNIDNSRQISRRNSVASTRIETPIHHHRNHSSSHQQHSRQSHSRQSRTSHSRAPSSIPLSPAPRSETPNAMRVRTRIAQVTAPSPTPLSYERARAYLPPALPSGYRLADPAPDPRATSPSPGHTMRMVRNVSESASRAQPPEAPPRQDNRPHPTPVASRTPSRAQSTREHKLSPNPRYL